MAEGLADVICDRDEVSSVSIRQVAVQAEDIEALAVDFLNEVLSVMQTDRFVVTSVRVKKIETNAVEADLAEARDVVAKVTFARPWYDRRASYLDCMKELTLAFPEEGVIWTTSLATQEDMAVVFSGKAVSESAVLDVLDRLKANPRLSDVKPLYLRQAGRTGREIAFAMSFTFTPSGRKWSSPIAKKSSSRQR